MEQQKRKIRGATLSEYGLLVGLIAILALAAISSIGENTEELFGDVATSMDGAITGTTASSSSAGPSPSPQAINAFYQCHNRPSFVVFAENVNGHTIVSQNDSQPFTDLAQACRDLGFSPIGTAHTSQPEANTGITDEVDALLCQNCNWFTGNNVWTFNNANGNYDCTAQNPEVASSIQSGDVLAGFIDTQASGIGAYQLNGSLADFLGDNSNEIPSPGPFSTSGNSGGSGSLGSPGSNDIFYTGTPDFLLCASTSGP